jgi:putative flippase GtrA
VKKFLAKFFDITFLKFVIVGVVNTLFGYGISLVCLNLLKMNLELSIAADYVLGSILSYFLNKRFTFNEKKNSAGYIVKFAINICVCCLLAYGIAEPLVEKILSSANQVVRDNVSLILVKGLFLVFNYIGQRFFVFTKKEEETSENS